MTVLTQGEADVSLTVKVVSETPVGTIRLPIGSKIRVGAVVTTLPLSERICQP